jgi:hypothetical protein
MARMRGMPAVRMLVAMATVALLVGGSSGCYTTRMALYAFEKDYARVASVAACATDGRSVLARMTLDDESHLDLGTAPSTTAAPALLLTRCSDPQAADGTHAARVIEPLEVAPISSDGSIGDARPLVAEDLRSGTIVWIRWIRGAEPPFVLRGPDAEPDCIAVSVFRLRPGDPRVDRHGRLDFTRPDLFDQRVTPRREHELAEVISWMAIFPALLFDIATSPIQVPVAVATHTTPRFIL